MASNGKKQESLGAQSAARCIEAVISRICSNVNMNEFFPSPKDVLNTAQVLRKLDPLGDCTLLLAVGGSQCSEVSFRSSEALAVPNENSSFRSCDDDNYNVEPSCGGGGVVQLSGETFSSPGMNRSREWSFLSNVTTPTSSIRPTSITPVTSPADTPIIGDRSEDRGNTNSLSPVVLNTQEYLDSKVVLLRRRR